ncbi:MAG: excisionase family DNA-binding protein [Lachnospiraceae bacterium]|nr:excisionase family DNA-binding protein [Lachnospiraceae bacterium]MCM1489073.1 excisionase family DNA-binding protein [Bacillota bacterium]
MAKDIQVPVWQKTHLTLDEAAAYTGIGRDKLRELSDENSEIVLWVGSKRLLNRKKLDNYLETIKAL